MNFRDREKLRLQAIAGDLFGADAEAPGLYKGVARPFCLPAQFASRNLHESIRDGAITYFRARRIAWHDGLEERRQPSNHTCSSQVACVNAWYPFHAAPTALREVLRGIGYSVAEVLAFGPEQMGRDREDGAVAFEWIGLRNYLGERTRGRVATDDDRRRGAGFTSADFAFRFRRADQRIQIVLGEWKYTESYGARDMRYSDAGTDRLDIYGPLLAATDSPIHLGDIERDALFFDPFDQLMRLQLLARQMEVAHELGADLVTVLHVAPSANSELAAVTSEGLEPLGATPHAIWSTLVGGDRFRGVHTEELLPLLVTNAPLSACGEWLNLRYGGMR